MVAAGAPSRKRAVFAFVCKKRTEWFRDNSSAERKKAIIVSLIVAPDAKIYVTDLVWRNLAAQVLLKDRWRDADFPFQADAQLDALRQVAEAYWRSDNPDSFGLGTFPEALIDGEAMVASAESK